MVSTFLEKYIKSMLSMLCVRSLASKINVTPKGLRKTAVNYSFL